MVSRCARCTLRRLDSDGTSKLATWPVTQNVPDKLSESQERLGRCFKGRSTCWKSADVLSWQDRRLSVARGSCQSWPPACRRGSPARVAFDGATAALIQTVIRPNLNQTSASSSNVTSHHVGPLKRNEVATVVQSFGIKLMLTSPWMESCFRDI